MNKIKDELQRIIFGNGPDGQKSQLKKVQRFLRTNAGTSLAAEKQQQFKSEETPRLLAFAQQEDLLYTPAIRETDFISEGAEPISGERPTEEIANNILKLVGLK